MVEVFAVVSFLFIRSFFFFLRRKIVSRSFDRMRAQNWIAYNCYKVGVYEQALLYPNNNINKIRPVLYYFP